MPVARRVAAVLVVIAVGATATAVLWQSTERTGDTVAPAISRVLEAPEQDDPEAGLPPEESLAPWMRAPAAPHVVGEPVVSARRVRRAVSAGGALIQLVADRHRYTLYVPAGAAALDSQVEIAQVTQLPGLGFAGPSHTVRISNLPASLRRPAVLTIEPVPPPGDAQPPLSVGFKVDTRSREAHAYPFAQPPSAPQPGAREPSPVRLQMLVGGDGVYGIAAATKAEGAALHASVPTDPLARLEAMIARALNGDMPTPTPAPASTASVLSGWWPIASAHAQQVDTAGLDPSVQRIVQSLRDYYAQKLRPRMALLGRGCSEKHREFFSTTISDANRWIQGAELVGLARSDEATAPPDPAVDPYRYHADAARHAQLTALAAEFDAKARELHDLARRGTKRMYRAVTACCRKSPQAWMPPYLMNMQREAEIYESAADLGPRGVADATDCACAVAAVRDGTGWTGTIRQTDRFSHEHSHESSRSRQTSNTTRQYALDVTLMGAGEDGAALGFASSTGESRRISRRVDTDWACAVDRAGSTVEVTGARGVSTGRVTIHLRKDGSYLVNFPSPIATGLERHHQYYKREGCKNRFNDRTTDITSMRAGAVSVLSQRTIRGRTDVATELSGSETESRPDPGRGIQRTTTIEWSLRACSAR